MRTRLQKVFFFKKEKHSIGKLWQNILLLLLRKLYKYIHEVIKYQAQLNGEFKKYLNPMKLSFE